jgi:hypothetical protein
MTIQEVIQFEKEINEIELTKNKSIDTTTMESFEKFYSDTVVMIESDGTTLNGKEECRNMEIGFNASMQAINAKDLISSVAFPSTDPNYEFMVVATWYYNIVTSMYPIDGTQTSIAYWKDGQIQKVQFLFPSEVIK